MTIFSVGITLRGYVRVERTAPTFTFVDFVLATLDELVVCWNPDFAENRYFSFNLYFSLHERRQYRQQISLVSATKKKKK